MAAPGLFATSAPPVSTTVPRSGAQFGASVRGGELVDEVGGAVCRPERVPVDLEAIARGAERAGVDGLRHEAHGKRRSDHR